MEAEALPPVEEDDPEFDSDVDGCSVLSGTVTGCGGSIGVIAGWETGLDTAGADTGVSAGTFTSSPLTISFFPFSIAVLVPSVLVTDTGEAELLATSTFDEASFIFTVEPSAPAFAVSSVFAEAVIFTGTVVANAVPSAPAFTSIGI